MENLFTELPEKQYIQRMSYEYRKKIGQFFTPLFIADLMTEWVVNNESGTKILDPAIGLGIFFRAIIKNHPDKIGFFKFHGYEIDNEMIKILKDLFKNISGISLNILNKDYLTNDWNETYDAIVCNPPYLKFHDYEPKDSLLQIFYEKMKIKLSGFTNIYALFVLKSIFQLKQGGRIAYIVPSEFLNSNYGKVVKNFIKESGALRFVILFDFKISVFENITTTSSILLFAKDKNNDEVEFINVKNLDEVNSLKNYILSYPFTRKKGSVIKIKALDEAQKWRIYYQQMNGTKYKYLVPFSKFVKVTRGIATGANSYFTFSESKRIKYQIEKQYCLPCLTKASYARRHFFTIEDFEKLKTKDKPIYLLNATNLTDNNLRKYIEFGEEQGVHRRYLTSHRTPWYAIENRPPANILVPVFNRSELRFIRNEAGVYNLTSFHCVYLYPNVITKGDLIMAYLITDIAKEIFEDSKREYGKGLKKFEPNDLNNALVVDISIIDKEIEREIVGLLYEFREKEIKGKNVNMIKSKLNEEFLKILKK